MILFQLFMVKKSIQIELDDFFNQFDYEDQSVTKQAYSLARKKVLPSTFIHLMKAVLRDFYAGDAFKTFYGYRLCAIDGSVFGLNNTQALRDHFGVAKNQAVSYARSYAACVYDVLNDMILTAQIGNYGSNERTVAKHLIEELKETVGFKNDLIICDRGYPSKDLIAFLEAHHLTYVMRASQRSMKEIIQTTEPDQHIQIIVKGKTIHARVLRFQLDSGDEEIIVTNLMDATFGILEFKELYFKRWGIEEKYKVLKSKLEVENLTGGTPLSVEQDFFAAMYLVNMVALVKQEANEMIQEADRNKLLKYEYQANTAMIIGKFKEHFIHLLCEMNQFIQEKIFRRILKGSIKNKTPIRPGRKYQRRDTKNASKFPLNRKRCL